MHMQCNAPQFPIRAEVMLTSIINMYKVRTYTSMRFSFRYMYVLIIFAVKWPKTTPHTRTHTPSICSIKCINFLFLGLPCQMCDWIIQNWNSRFKCTICYICRRKKQSAENHVVCWTNFHYEFHKHAGKTEILK